MFRRSFLTLLVALSVSTTALAAPRAGHVVIVSLDGGKPAVMQQSPMPVTMALKQGGAATWVANTIFPSITLPSHTSMLTGVGPEKHKIDWNGWSPDKGVVGVPTIFTLAKKAGHTTAMFAGKEKFKHLEQPESLDKFVVPSDKSPAKEVAAEAAKYIVESKPELTFVHFPDSDTMGHKYGWGSAEQIQAFADEDVALKMLTDALEQAGIAKDTVIIITADHGGHDHTHGSRDPQDMNIPWIASGKGVKPGFEITAPVTTYDTAATALWLLDVAIPADFDGKPVTSAFEDAPAGK